MGFCHLFRGEITIKFLALEKDVPGVTEKDFTPAILRAEAKRAWDLYQKGIFCEMYFRKDIYAAVLMLECRNLNDAKRALNSLPLVKRKLSAFDILPLRAYDGFERLFNNRK